MDYTHGLFLIIKIKKTVGTFWRWPHGLISILTFLYCGGSPPLLNHHQFSLEFFIIISFLLIVNLLYTLKKLCQLEYTYYSVERVYISLKLYISSGSYCRFRCIGNIRTTFCFILFRSYFSTLIWFSNTKFGKSNLSL